MRNKFMGLYWNLNLKSEVLPKFLLFSAYKKYSVTTVVSLSLMPCTSFFPALYYSSVQLKRLNRVNSFYQFEIRSEKKLLFSVFCRLYFNTRLLEDTTVKIENCWQSFFLLLFMVFFYFRWQRNLLGNILISGAPRAPEARAWAEPHC